MNALGKTLIQRDRYLPLQDDRLSRDCGDFRVHLEAALHSIGSKLPAVVCIDWLVKSELRRDRREIRLLPSGQRCLAIAAKRRSREPRYASPAHKQNTRAS